MGVIYTFRFSSLLFYPFLQVQIGQLDLVKCPISNPVQSGPVRSGPVRFWYFLSSGLLFREREEGSK